MSASHHTTECYVSGDTRYSDGDHSDRGPKTLGKDVLTAFALGDLLNYSDWHEVVCALIVEINRLEAAR